MEINGAQRINPPDFGDPQTEKYLNIYLSTICRQKKNSVQAKYLNTLVFLHECHNECSPVFLQL